MARRSDRKEERPSEQKLHIRLSKAMLLSPAYRSLSGNDLLVLSVIMAKHLETGRCRNGRLEVRYDHEFGAIGLGRSTISKSIRKLEALGFIDVRRSGYITTAGKRPANLYRITFDDGFDESVKVEIDGATRFEVIKAPAKTNDWAKIKTVEEAQIVLNDCGPEPRQPTASPRYNASDAAHEVSCQLGGSGSLQGV